VSDGPGHDEDDVRRREEGGERDRQAMSDDTTQAAPLRPDPKLLELLVCPLTKTPLVYDREANELVSKAAKLAFPIRHGIPIMLVSEAREID
jgi:uncharacterized protein YbaR (Trm112 family)